MRIGAVHFIPRLCRRLVRRLVHRCDHFAHQGVEFFSGVGIDPRAIGIGTRRARVDVAPDLGIDPEARQQRRQRHWIRRAPRGGDEEAGVVMAGRRQRGAGERVAIDAELLHEAFVQAAFDHHGVLGGVGELHHAVGMVGLGGGDRQGAAEGQQVVGVLDHVVAERLFAELAAGQFLVERHGARFFVQRGVARPGVGAERHGNPQGRVERCARARRGGGPKGIKTGAQASMARTGSAQCIH